MSKDTGGPAFPTIDYITPTELATNQNGMTLRDYFAGKFAAAYFSSVTDIIVNHDGTRHLNGAPPDDIAENAYKFADAMISERAK